jgi:hypothetical protein
VKQEVGMGLVGFVVEEKGKDTGGAVLHVEAPAGPDEYSRAVDDLVSRKALDDPEAAQMIAGHFAEVALSKYIEGDQAAAARAGNALLAVLGETYVVVRASRLRGDIEITEIARLEAKSMSEAEMLFTATMEKIAGAPTGH